MTRVDIRICWCAPRHEDDVLRVGQIGETKISCISLQHGTVSSNSRTPDMFTKRTPKSQPTRLSYPRFANPLLELPPLSEKGDSESQPGIESPRWSKIPQETESEASWGPYSDLSWPRVLASDAETGAQRHRQEQTNTPRTVTDTEADTCVFVVTAKELQNIFCFERTSRPNEHC